MYQKTILSDDVAFIDLDMPGVRIRPLYTDASSGAMTVLTEMAAGASIPEHWHTAADETVFVLRGDFIENGTAYGPGTFFVGKAGTSHGPHETRSGCTVISNFSAPLDFQMGKPDAG
jgi:anti-sigma factor ChrR (cupin superfamily)